MWGLMVLAASLLVKQAQSLRAEPALLPGPQLLRPTASGYLDVDRSADSAMFYTYYESQGPKPSATLPIILWLQARRLLCRAAACTHACTNSQLAASREALAAPATLAASTSWGRTACSLTSASSPTWVPGTMRPACCSSTSLSAQASAQQASLCGCASAQCSTLGAAPEQLAGRRGSGHPHRRDGDGGRPVRSPAGLLPQVPGAATTPTVHHWRVVRRQICEGPSAGLEAAAVEHS